MDEVEAIIEAACIQAAAAIVAAQITALTSVKHEVPAVVDVESEFRDALSLARMNAKRADQ